ncbi:MAG: hypothetical protein IT561_02725 [Alphaproteobacteria bacterium]|nr:hypothetical protein [Alphaproteobacteria bacterium]
MLGVPVLLLSPRGAAAAMGPLMFQAMVAAARRAEPEAAVTGAIDCEDAEGHVLLALRAGVDVAIFKGAADVAAKLAAIAAAGGRRLLPERPSAPALAGARDPAALCRDWLAGGVAQSTGPA